jgi:CMP/dCMP kinase
MAPFAPLVVAIDGPAASGKGTLARKLAAHLGLEHLDTGSLYRAAALKLLESGMHFSDTVAAVTSASTITIADLKNPALTTEEVASVASIVAAIPEVRQCLLSFQRNFASNPNGAVLDGRDIGTVICPDATIKIYITASIASRATRRFKELRNKGKNVIYEDVLTDLQERDNRDSKRTVSPLAVAKDAVVIDTSTMDADMVLEKVLSCISPLLNTTS